MIVEAMGEYQMVVNTDVTLPAQGEYSFSYPRWEIVGGACKAMAPSTGGGPVDLPGVLGGIEIFAPLTGADPRSLSGSKTERNGEITTAVTWNLTRYECGSTPMRTPHGRS